MPDGIPLNPLYVICDDCANHEFTIYLCRHCTTPISLPGSVYGMPGYGQQCTKPIRLVEYGGTEAAVAAVGVVAVGGTEVIVAAVVIAVVAAAVVG